MLLNWQNGVMILQAAWANTVEQTCQNFAALRNFNGSGGAQQVYAEGQSVQGDGGQGAFYWNATASGVTDDNLTTIVPYGATVGCWTRLSYDSTFVQTTTATSGTSTTLASTINTIFVDVAAPFSVNLPASPFLGEIHRIIDTSGAAATNPITVAGSINGGTNYIIDANYGSVTIEYNGTNWSTVAVDVGAYVSATVLVGSAVGLTTATPANVANVSLPAGDWDVRGNVAFAIASGTTVTVAAAWTSQTSATEPTIPNGGGFSQIAAETLTGISGGSTYVMPVGSQRFLLSGTTTIYLSAQSSFGSSTNSVYGFIGARRAR